MAEEKKSTILGSFEGECADSNITNLNGMDITRPVWEHVFESDEYKRAVEMGWYIGYLGHPAEPDCQDFKDACIVMRSGRIDEDGKVYGKFDLIDTPVGRIVKAFIDAGVIFGISVRGAGDLVGNSVDPETFIFRGFDLVAFPAFPESVPTFTEIAASTDLERRSKYKAVCAAVKNNIADITSTEALEFMKSQFAPQSEEYASICEQIDSISSDDHETEALVEEVEELSDDAECSIDQDRLDGVMQLYLEKCEEAAALFADVERLTEELEASQKSAQAASVDAAKKLNAVKRITAAQLNDEKRKLTAETAALRQQLDEASSENLKYTQKISAATAKVDSSKAAIKKLQDDLADARSQVVTANSEVKAAKQSLSSKDRTILGLKKELRETVAAATKHETKASNLGEELENLKKEITATKKLVRQYQEAYANLYASAIGTDLSRVNVTASTSVDELKKIVRSTSAQPLDAFSRIDGVDLVDREDEEGFSADLVTM